MMRATCLTCGWHLQESSVRGNSDQVRLDNLYQRTREHARKYLPVHSAQIVWENH